MSGVYSEHFTWWQVPWPEQSFWQMTVSISTTLTGRRSESEASFCMSSLTTFFPVDTASPQKGPAAASDEEEEEEESEEPSDGGATAPPDLRVTG